MKNEPINHIFLDMDGVLADLIGAACGIFGRYDLQTGNTAWPPGEYSIARVLGITADRLWAAVNRQGVDWWAHLEPLPHYLDLLGLVISTGRTWSILTSGHVSDYAATGKSQWITRHLPAYRDRLIITKEKHLLAGPDRVLIDDSDENCRRFIEAGGRAIVYPQPWNSAHLYAGRPLPTVKRQLVEMGIFPQAITDEN